MIFNILTKPINRIEKKLIELADTIGTQLIRAIDSRIELDQVKKDFKISDDSRKYYMNLSNAQRVQITELQDKIDKLERPKKKPMERQINNFRS